MLASTIGCAVLLMISFAVAGSRWPMELLHVWNDPLVHHEITRASPVAAIAGSMRDALYRRLFVVAVYIAGTVVAFVAAGRVEIANAVALAVAAGVLCSPHVYLQDYLLCIPLLIAATCNLEIILPPGGIEPGRLQPGSHSS